MSASHKTHVYIQYTLKVPPACVCKYNAFDMRVAFTMSDSWEFSKPVSRFQHVRHTNNTRVHYMLAKILLLSCFDSDPAGS